MGYFTASKMHTYPVKDPTMPNKDGYFGEYGGAFLPPPLVPIFEEITAKYEELKADPNSWAELHELEKQFTGRPSPIFHAKRLRRWAARRFYLKREDLNHTGAHKINHCLGEALLAKRMGKKKLIAETGAASTASRSPPPPPSSASRTSTWARSTWRRNAPTSCA